MSVNRKVRVPVGGLATSLDILLASLIRGHYSSATFLGSFVFAQVPVEAFSLHFSRAREGIVGDLEQAIG